MKPVGMSLRNQCRSGPAEIPIPAYEELSSGGPEKDRALLHCLLGMAEGLDEPGLREEVTRFLAESIQAMARGTMEGLLDRGDLQK